MIRLMDAASYVELNNKLDTVIQLLERNTTSSSSCEWLTNSDVTSELSICNRSLQNYRDAGMIGFSKVGRKIMYKRSDVSQFLEQFHQAPFLAKQKKRIIQQKNEAHV